MHSSILRWIWFNFMAQYLVFSAPIQVSQFFFRISNLFGLSTTEVTWLVEMHIWCIKIGIVLVLHLDDMCDYKPIVYLTLIFRTKWNYITNHNMQFHRLYMVILPKVYQPGLLTRPPALVQLYWYRSFAAVETHPVFRVGTHFFLLRLSNHTVDVLGCL
jgi:hypothetical protein